MDSALHAPQAGFGDHDFYLDLVEKAAVLAVRIARTQPLPDGNKRLTWGCLNMVCEFNGQILDVPADDAVAQMVAVAAGEVDAAAVARWLVPRLSKSGQPAGARGWRYQSDTITGWP